MDQSPLHHDQAVCAALQAVQAAQAAQLFIDHKNDSQNVHDHAITKATLSNLENLKKTTEIIFSAFRTPIGVLEFIPYAY